MKETEDFPVVLLVGLLEYLEVSETHLNSLLILKCNFNGS
jgi:hypothetical protein